MKKYYKISQTNKQLYTSNRSFISKTILLSFKRNMIKNYQAIYKPKERFKVLRSKRSFRIYIDQYVISMSKDISTGI